MPFLLIVGLICAAIGAAWAKSKNRSPVTWGIVCFLTGFLGLIILAFQRALPSGEVVPTVVHVAGPVEVAGPDMKRWQALVEVDDDIEAAATAARNVGPQYEQMLAEKYLALNDKQYLKAVLGKVLNQARQDLQT
jgi:hypothetical protein